MSNHNAPNKSLNRAASDSVMIAMRKIIQAIDLNSKKLVKRVGLTGPQLVILQEISSWEEMTAGEIAKAVSLSQSTVTGILDRLQKRQLIRRRRSVGDKRRIMVGITDSGIQISQIGFVFCIYLVQPAKPGQQIVAIYHCPKSPSAVPV